MASLYLKGYRIIVIGRAAGSEPPESRILRILKWFSIPEPAPFNSKESRLKVYDADFSKTRLGLGDDDYNEICRLTDIIIHAASDTSFAETSRNRVFEANVENLQRIITLAGDGKVSCFHYISSAFGSGTDFIDNPEIPFRSGNYTNVYEESKAEAEKKVTQLCGKLSIPFTLIRPSIVFGDSDTGRALKFNALYYPVKSLMHIRDIYINNIKKCGTKDTEKHGIFIDEDGILHLPVRLYLKEPGKINLIPVNYFTKAVTAIIENPEDKGIYNIANPDPLSVESLIEYTESFLKIRGIEPVYGNAAKVIRNPAEELFDHFIKPYLPYLSDQRFFPAGTFDQPPCVTYDIFERCMNYAVSTQWGKKLFP